MGNITVIAVALVAPGFISLHHTSPAALGDKFLFITIAYPWFVGEYEMVLLSSVVGVLQFV